MTLSEDKIAATAAAYEQFGSYAEAGRHLGVDEKTVRNHVKLAAERGLLGTKPVLPGFRLSKSTAVLGPDGTLQREFVQQKPEIGEKFEVPDGQKVKAVSALVDPSGRELIKWIKTDQDRERSLSMMKAAVDGFIDEIGHAEPVQPPAYSNDELLAQYTLTDVHLGALAWNEETGGGDYDLTIAEKLVENWFASAISMAPPTKTAILAQLGDLLHHDSHESVTPAHRHILDADSRFQKIVRVAIRLLRKVMRLLLQKHEEVHVILADANHDPASGAWLREMFAAFYEHEPRVSVDRSAGTYYSYTHGEVSLFFHHGHRRKPAEVASVFAKRFRGAYGSTKYSYAHTGHRHSDERLTTELMKVEQHETLAAQDAYAANGGYPSDRSAKVIVYHKEYGEVARVTLTPEMVKGRTAENDNQMMGMAA